MRDALRLLDHMWTSDFHAYGGLVLRRAIELAMREPGPFSDNDIVRIVTRARADIERHEHCRDEAEAYRDQLEDDDGC